MAQQWSMAVRHYIKLCIEPKDNATTHDTDQRGNSDPAWKKSPTYYTKIQKKATHQLHYTKPVWASYQWIFCVPGDSFQRDRITEMACLLGPISVFECRRPPNKSKAGRETGSNAPATGKNSHARAHGKIFIFEYMHIRFVF